MQSFHFSSLLACLIVLAAPPAWAINKCTDAKGKTVYQQATCPETQTSKSVNTSGAGKADPGSAGAQYWSQQVSEDKRRAEVDKAINRREIFIGMTSAEVTRSWGRPTKINTTITRGASTAQWVYRSGDGGGPTQYVYIEDGVVRSMQTEGE